MDSCPFLTIQKSGRDESTYPHCGLTDMPVCVFHEKKTYEKCPGIKVVQGLRCPKCGNPVI